MKQKKRYPLKLPVPWAPHYEVYRTGTVVSRARNVLFVDGRMRRFPRRTLKHWYQKDNTYAYVKIGDRVMSVHRLVYEVFIGPIPPDKQVDHIDGNIRNNHPSNLRAVDRQQNACNKSRYKNNRSGYSGVCYTKRTGRWRATIQLGRKQVHLGYHDTPEEAHRARVAAEFDLFGEYARRPEHKERNTT